MSDTGRMGQDVTYAVFLEPAWKNGQKSDVEYSRPSEKEEREKQDLKRERKKEKGEEIVVSRDPQASLHDIGEGNVDKLKNATHVEIYS